METFMHYTQFTSDWLLQVVTDTSQWCDMSHHRTVLTGGGTSAILRLREETIITDLKQWRF